MNGKINKKLIEEMLVTHTDALMRDQPSRVDAETYPDDVSRLFDLSGQLHATLHPIQPSREFVSGLNSRLSDGWQLTMSQRRRLVQLIKTMGIIMSLLMGAALATQLIGVVISSLTRSKSRQVEAS